MRSRDLWLYLASRFCSASAMMMLRAAIAWHVFALSHSAFHLGLIGLVQFVPVVSLMLVGGALADAYDRRRIMMLAQSIPLACTVLLFLATRAGVVGLPMLYVVVALVGVAWAFDSPSRAALLPTLVPRDVFPRAVTIASTNQALAFTTGPAVGGWVIATAGIGTAYAVQAALIAASLVTLAAMRARRGQAPGGVFSLRAIREGLGFVRRQPVILGREHGFSYIIQGDSNSGLPTLAAAVAGQIKPAQVVGFQHVGRSQIDYASLHEGEDLQQAFDNSFGVVARNLKDSHHYRLEIDLLYGQDTNGLGTVQWSEATGTTAQRRIYRGAFVP